VAVAELIDGALCERDEFVLTEMEIVVEGVESSVEPVRSGHKRVRVESRRREPGLGERRRHGVGREPIV